MLLSVAICTHNRAPLLRRTLDSLAGVAIPPDVTWEVIVVDNNSNDKTPSVVLAFHEALPLRSVVEPRVGLSSARNTAVRKSHGDYILWIDDDVLVDPGWLRSYAEAFRRWPDAAFFGGPIAPLFEGDPPPWLRDALGQIGNAYAARDLGADERRLDGWTLPFGANMAVRAAEQRAHPYDARLGRRGSMLYAGEEAAVLQALLAEGAEGRWVPSARVQHIIPEARQTLRYLRRYYVGNGASWALVRPNGNERMLLGRPRWVWREAVQQEAAYRLRRLYAPPAVWSEHFRRSSVAWGMLRGKRPR
jgi:glycosyltransferase involved in cell wall biosynthesis